MFYLAQKTYLYTDKLITYQKDRIVISQEHGLPMLESLDAISSGALLSYAATVEDLIGEGKQHNSYVSFFRSMFEREHSQFTGMIFADQNAFMKLSAAWCKIIFADVDGPAAFRLVKAYFEKQALFGPRVTREARDVFKDFSQKETEFLAIFNAITIDPVEALTLVNDYRDDLAIEYLLASYGYNNSQVTSVKKSIHKMVNRAVEEQLKEMLYLIYANMLVTSFQQFMGMQTYTVDNVELILTDPAILPLVRANEWRATTATFENPRPVLDLTVYTEEEYQDLITAYKKAIEYFYGAELGDILYNHNRMQYIDYTRQTTLSNEDLEAIIDNEINSQYETRLWSARDQDSVNVFFADFVLEQIKNNTTSNLSKYLIRA